MSKRRRCDPKSEALRQDGLLNARPQSVTDPLFLEHEFFDARDLLQVKYEMIRRVQKDKIPVTDVVATFGFSRPTFYQAQSAFHDHGLAGLLPKKRGPRRGYKLTEEVLSFIEQARVEDTSLDTHALVGLLLERFGVQVHPRSIERVLQRGEKKRR